MNNFLGPVFTYFTAERIPRNEYEILYSEEGDKNDPWHKPTA